MYFYYIWWLYTYFANTYSRQVSTSKWPIIRQPDGVRFCILPVHSNVVKFFFVFFSNWLFENSVTRRVTCLWRGIIMILFSGSNIEMARKPTSQCFECHRGLNNMKQIYVYANLRYLSFRKNKSITDFDGRCNNSDLYEKKLTESIFSIFPSPEKYQIY